MPASPPNTAPFEPKQFHSEFGYLAPTARFRRQAALTIKAAALGALVGAAAVFFVLMEREEKAFTMVSMPVPSTTGLRASLPPAASTPEPASPAPSMRSASVPVSPPRALSAPVSSAPISPPPMLAMQMSSKPGSSAPPSMRGAPSARAVAAKGWQQVPFVPESVALPAAVPVVVPAAAPATPTIAHIQGLASPDVAAVPPELRPVAPAIAAAPAVAAKAAKPKKRIVSEPPRGYPDPRSVYAAERRAPGFLGSIFGLGL